MVVPALPRRVRRIAVPEVLGVDHDRRLSFGRVPGLDLHLCEGRYRDVEDLPVAREPSVGPAPVVTDPDGSDGVNDARDGGTHDGGWYHPARSGEPNWLPTSGPGPAPRPARGPSAGAPPALFVPAGAGPRAP